MTAGERFRNWVDGIASGWADRLREWMASWLAWGMELLLDIVGRGMGKRLDVIIDAFAEKYDIPPDIAADVKEAWKGEGEWQAILGGAAGGTAVGSLIGSTIGPWLKLLEYVGLKIAKPFRSDPALVITAWRRDKVKYEKLFEDLKDQGWDDDRIEALKFATLFYPAPADLIRWQAREVFEPEMIARYGLDSEFGAIEKEPFYKAGMTDEQILNYWRAHWEHASWMQVVEMLHRGLVTETEVYDWFRLVEIPPFWRDLLIKTAYTWPTRVDVRRWWDMRTIDETRLRELYSGMGYRGTNLEDYIKWTKVYVDFPMMMARFSKGWITEEDVRSWLKGLKIPEDRINQFIEEKTQPEKAERVTKEKDLTKTEIYKGVKKVLISWEEGLELLMDMGYDEDEADYILAVNVGVLEGSPETYAEFKDITTKYKIATGKEVKPMTEELKKAASEVVRLTAEVKALEESITEEKRGLIEGEVLPEETTARLDELQVARNRAISALELAKSEYNRLIAEWRHGSPE
ncbi:hypothetical protein ES708_15433 [subsurface metagenome]